MKSLEHALTSWEKARKWIPNYVTSLRDGEFSNCNYKKAKYAIFSDKLTFLNINNPVYVHVRLIWCALFSCNSSFEIQPFALWPTIKSFQVNVTFLHFLKPSENPEGMERQHWLEMG